MKKKGESILIENIGYILLVLVFVSILFFAITRVGSQATIYEQAYAKQIALVINQVESGMEIELDIFEISELARKNDFKGQIIAIDNSENKVTVRLAEGKGYEYYFFVNNEVVWNTKQDKECLISTRCLSLKIIENEVN